MAGSIFAERKMLYFRGLQSDLSLELESKFVHLSPGLSKKRGQNGQMNGQMLWRFFDLI